MSAVRETAAPLVQVRDALYRAKAQAWLLRLAIFGASDFPGERSTEALILGAVDLCDELDAMRMLVDKAVPS